MLSLQAIERTRLQIIWLIAKGYTAQEVALVTGYRRGSIYKIVSRYNAMLPDLI
ncbi:helix-turn-helix domain-containing protein [Scytonema hofmannii]|uniref:helix-turn-helix domain-containing protein n=1 Tax=Scytonema hofmannii TaxID=34078 RepID=UPI000345C8A7|nr:helix-turn-helix domain-containing protein [Scytonema hofmannii]